MCDKAELERKRNYGFALKLNYNIGGERKSVFVVAFYQCVYNAICSLNGVH